MKPLKNVRRDFFLNIQNNTANAQNVVLFDVLGAYNGTNAAAGNIKYQWDITTELADAVTNAESTMIVLAAMVNGPFTKYTYVKPSETNVPDWFTTADQVVTGLNTLGIGTFTNVGNIITGYSLNAISSINICNTYTAAANGGSLVFGTNGSLIYDTGYTTALIGNLSQINTGNAFWINNPAASLAGPFSRAAITPVAAPAISTGFFGQISLSAAQTVYIGFSFTGNQGNIYVNNELIINLPGAGQITNVGNNVNTVLGTAFNTSNIIFNCWHIIPVTLPAGTSIIQMDAIGIMGLEIYGNTAVQIAAAGSYNDLNLLLTSIDYAGNQFF
mgnify:CR=1 FL=1